MLTVPRQVCAMLVSEPMNEFGTRQAETNTAARIERICDQQLSGIAERDPSPIEERIQVRRQ